MWRHAAQPREGWRDIVVSEGLVFPDTVMPDGSTTPYWNESAWYEFTLEEVLALEAATETLWGMCVEAVDRMAATLDDARLGLPAGALALARESVRRGDPSVYGRFDLRYDADGSVKLLELNGDTPTGLVETGVTQWRWLESVLPDNDQWNSLHERLIERWSALDRAGGLPGHEVHFLYSEAETTGEEEMTVHYMQDTAAQAGLLTYSHPIEHVGWNPRLGRFLDRDGRPIRNAFKLYPWEAMLGEEFGSVLLQHHEVQPVRWIEPAWKMLLSTKALLPTLWEMFPGHELLLASYWDHPHELTDWVAKPLHGREGDNIRVHLSDGTDTQQPGSYGDEGFVYQQWAPLPSLDGNFAMIGSWIVDGQAAGMVVRESDGYITDYYSRVVPHVIGDGLAPDLGTQLLWRAERAPDRKPGLAGPG
jgi:glutathionylspermidine synthase